MSHGGNMLAEAFAQALLVGQDAGCVLAMSEQNGWHLGKQALQNAWVVHQHIAGGGAHEHFDPSHFTGVEGGDGVEVVVAHAKVKAVVGH